MSLKEYLTFSRICLIGDLERCRYLTESFTQKLIFTKHWFPSSHPGCTVDELVFIKKKTCDVTCSAMDPLQWMGAVRMRAKQLIKYCEAKSCVRFLTVASCQNTNLNNVSFSEKVPPFCPLTTMFTYMFRTVVECLLDLFIFLSWIRQDEFFTEESNMTHFSRKQHFEVTNVLMMERFTSEDVNWWLELYGLLEDDCDVFISCLDSHSDGTHSLQSIHWWASDVMLNFSTSVLMKKQTHLHLDDLKVCGLKYYLSIIL